MLTPGNWAARVRGLPPARRAAAAAAAALLVAHVGWGGVASAKRWAWLARRNAGAGSSEPAWRARHVRADRAVREVLARVPAAGRLVVVAADPELAHEVAFYCYPRPVAHAPAGPPGDGRLVAEAGPGVWHVYPDAPGGPD